MKNRLMIHSLVGLLLALTTVSTVRAQVTLSLDPPGNPTRVLLDFAGGPPIKAFFWFEASGSSGDQKTIRTDQLLLGSTARLHSVTNATAKCGAIALPSMVKDSIFISLVGTYSFSITAMGPCATTAPLESIQIDPTGITRFRSGDLGHGAVIEFSGNVIGGGGPPGAHRPGKGSCGCCCGLSDYRDGSAGDSNYRGLFPQVGSDLCWAAVTQTVLYRILGREYDQCEIARTMEGDLSGCPNYPNAFLSVANLWLRNNGYGENWYVPRREFSQIANDLSASDSMLPVFIQWSDGGFGAVGHYMIILDATGPVADPLGAPPTSSPNPTITALTIFDPLPVDEGDVFMLPVSAAIDGARFRLVEYYRHG